MLNGGASVITNSHIYNGGTEALLGNLGAEAVKVTGSYFDGCGVVLLRPVAVSITNSLFLGGVGIELRSTFPGAWCAGNLITGNQFIISSVTTPGPWLVEIPVATENLLENTD